MFEVFAKETPLVKIVSSRRRFGWRRIGSSSGGGSSPSSRREATASWLPAVSLRKAVARAGCTCSPAGRNGMSRGCARTPSREVSSGRVPTLLTECAWRRGKCRPPSPCGRPARASRRSSRSAGHSRRRGARGEPRRQSPTLPCVRAGMPPTATQEPCPWQPRYRECVGRPTQPHPASAFVGSPATASELPAEIKRDRLD